MPTPGAGRSWPSATAATPGSGWRSSARSTAGPARCSALLIADKEFRAAAARPRRCCGTLATQIGSAEPQGRRRRRWSRRSTRCPRARRRWPRTLVRSLVSKAAAGRPRAARRLAGRQGRGRPRRPARATPGRPPPTRSSPIADRVAADPHARPGAVRRRSRTCSADLAQAPPAAAGAGRRPGDAGPLRPAGRAGAGARGLAGAQPAAAGTARARRCSPGRPGSRPSSTRWSRARSAAATWTRRASSCCRRTPTRRLRARAAKLFAATELARRQDVVAAYQKALRAQGRRGPRQGGLQEGVLRLPPARRASAPSAPTWPPSATAARRRCCSTSSTPTAR